jgi:anti-sigma factor (TIGR02949 family)
MNCDEARSLLENYVDGELDAGRAAELAQHLQTCPGCGGELARLETLSRAIRSEIRRHRAPVPLRRAAEDLLAVPEAPTRPDRGRRRLVGAIAASLIAGAIASGSATYLTTRELLGPGSLDRLAADLVASHMRALVAATPIDVASSDRHTVKPWFAGKIDLSPPVTDFKEQGFALEGGRLDYVAGRPVPVVVYRHREHLIGLYALPDDGRDSAPERFERDGYNLLHWRQNGLALWAISDVEFAQLAEFVELVRNAD